MGAENSFVFVTCSFEKIRNSKIQNFNLLISVVNLAQTFSKIKSNKIVYALNSQIGDFHFVYTLGCSHVVYDLRKS